MAKEPSSQLEIRVIEYWAKNDGFATSETRYWKVQLWRTDLGSFKSIDAGLKTHAEAWRVAEEWASFVSGYVAEFEERRQYTTALVRLPSGLPGKGSTDE